MLQKCRLGVPFSPEETKTLIDHPYKIGNATRLLCTRKEVAAINMENFNKLKTPTHVYRALDGFKWSPRTHPHLHYYNRRLPDGTLESCKDQRLESMTTLRVGMLVILQTNLDLSIGLCNGSQGIICGFEPFDPAKLPVAKDIKRASALPLGTSQVLSGDYAQLREGQIRSFIEGQQTKAWPRVQFSNSIKHTIFASCMVNSVGDSKPYPLLHRTQIPLVAGWAMSVHKSQGMTLPRVIVNLSKAFEEGQVYVALSRATCLEGLKIEGGSQGFWIANGGNMQVQTFLREKFGESFLFDALLAERKHDEPKLE